MPDPLVNPPANLLPWRPRSHRAPRPYRGLLTALAMLVAASGLRASTLRDYYVAPDGNDSHPGTEAKPFATLEAARDAVRRQKQQGALPRGGITVWLRGGDYPRRQAFELGAADGGSPGSPVVYRAFPKEKVRLLGGLKVGGFVPVADEAVRLRLPEPARSKVVQLDLKAAGVTDLGQFRSRGFGRPLTPAHLELFHGGVPMTPARWPNEGEWERIAGFPADSGQGDDHGGQIGKLDGGFLYAGDRPRSWKSLEDVWVHGYWAWDWANSYERIDSLDPEKHLIRTAPPHGLYGFRKGQRFYFVHVLEELDQPGEYYVDRGSARLYFWPPAKEGETLVSQLEQPLIKLTEVSHVTLRGVRLEATRGNGIEIRGGASNHVTACVLRLIGNYGVTLEGGRGHAVSGCDIEETGDGGVSVAGGDRQTLTPGRHRVENNHFQKQGRWSKCYVPSVILSGVGHRVAHNLMHDHPHCPVLYTGNDHLIEFNEIHHVALETGDVGGIYSGRDWTFRGNKIRHNFLHHIGGVGMGSMAVYMDDCVSGTEIFGNVFYKVQRAAFLGGGRDHRVENNLFVDCQPAVQVDGRGLDASPVWKNMVYDFMKKQLQAVPAELYRKRYPAINTLDRWYAGDRGVPPLNNVIVRNVSVGGEWLSVGWNARKEWLVVQQNYVGDDPGFYDRAGMDFRIRRGSPVWKLGFQPIPMERIGLRRDAERREVESLRK